MPSKGVIGPSVSPPVPSFFSPKLFKLQFLKVNCNKYKLQKHQFCYQCTPQSSLVLPCLSLLGDLDFDLFGDLDFVLPGDLDFVLPGDLDFVLPGDLDLAGDLDFNLPGDLAAMISKSELLMVGRGARALGAGVSNGELDSSASNALCPSNGCLATVVFENALNCAGRDFGL